MAQQQKTLEDPQKIKQIAADAFGILGKIFSFYLGKNPEFSAKSTFEIYFWNAIENGYIERTVRHLKLANDMSKRKGKSNKIQSADTALRRLKKKDEGDIIQEMKMANRKVLIQGKKERAFNKPIDCSVDIHDVLRYTKIKKMEKRKKKCDDLPKAVGIKEKDGAHFAHKYMTLESVNTNKRYTFDFDPVTPFTNRVKVFDRLVKTTKGFLGNNLRLIYGDGGFSGVGYIQSLNANKVSYVVRAPKNSRVKKELENAWRLQYYVKRDFVVGEGKNSVKTDLVAIHRDLLKKRDFDFNLMKKEDVFFTYFTDRRPGKGVDELEFYVKMALGYSKRWGIETGYSDKNDFLGKTHSLSYNVRLFLFLLAIFLYNLWMLFDRGDFAPGELITKDIVSFALWLAIFITVVGCTCFD